ncbi:hypothetical protein HDU91_000161, partial [Kappamyces sp. JEL0680]
MNALTVQVVPTAVYNSNTTDFSPYVANLRYNVWLTLLSVIVPMLTLFLGFSLAFYSLGLLRTRDRKDLMKIVDKGRESVIDKLSQSEARPESVLSEPDINLSDSQTVQLKPLAFPGSVKSFVTSPNATPTQLEPSLGDVLTDGSP